ncbi:MAG: sigma-70 family RNA polymerase sigma factor [Prochloraceae cyanobacterium]
MTHKKDLVGTYLKEISQISLLTTDEEIKLGHLVQELLKLERVHSQLLEASKSNPSESEWALFLGINVQQLRHRLQAGRRAKYQFIQANLRLVFSIAKKYLNRGLPLEDLIQEGTLGLIKATEKFDPDKGYKFSTYATWWIRQALTRAVNNFSRTIRLPAHITRQKTSIAQICQNFQDRWGRQPTEEEIAATMEITVDKLRFILKSIQPIASLDKLVGKEKDITIGELIVGGDRAIEETLLLDCLNCDLNRVLDRLEDREAQVLRLRYGINNGEMKTSEEIGQILNCSSTSIRKIEARAIRKLRQAQSLNLLKDYLN